MTIDIGNLPTVQDSAHQGADYIRTLRYKDSNGQPKSLTGYECYVQWRTSQNGKAALSLSNGAGITITGSTGTIEIHAAQSQLKAMRPDVYHYDLILVLPDGTPAVLLSVEVRLKVRYTRVEEF